MTINSGRVNWYEVFGRNFNGLPVKGTKEFIRHLPRTLGVFPREVTRGEISVSLYISGNVGSIIKAEELCDIIEKEGGFCIKTGDRSSFQLRITDNGKYKPQRLTSYGGVK